MSVNKAILVGRLGGDPEVRYTGAGTPVANFSIATSEHWTDRDGQKQERTDWHKIVVWKKLAEICGKHLAKGRQVYIEGRMQTREWKDREDNRRFTTEVIATTVRFLDSKKNGPQSMAPEDTPPPMDYSDQDVPY
jgi:single-strand DNA-binding protein